MSKPVKPEASRGAGAEIGLLHTKSNTTLFLRWMREFEARNHFQGDYFGLLFVKGF